MARIRKTTNLPDERPPSRSAKKRASTAIQKLGEELAELSPATRVELDLPEELAMALNEHDRIHDREGSRRQRQYIGRLMRGMDCEPIARALAERRRVKSVQISSFHKAEQWRDKLVSASEAEEKAILCKFATTFQAHADDMAHISSLLNAIRTGNQNGGKKSAAKAARELFRLVNRMINLNGQVGN